MAEKTVIVRPEIAGGVPQDYLDQLANLLRQEDFNVRVGFGEFPYVPPEGVEYEDDQVVPWLETICIWFAQGAVTTLGGATVLAAIKVMRSRFLKESDEGECIRCVELIEDEGAEGRVKQRVELEGADAEPVIRDLHKFESYTRKKPSDLID